MTLTTTRYLTTTTLYEQVDAGLTGRGRKTDL